MTVRTAELIAAVALALLSLGIMWKATDGLAIGWIRNEGPGSGVWPFWLSLLMFLSCLATIFNWYRGATPESRSREAFMSQDTMRIIGVTVAALVLLLLGTHIVGLYISMLLFLVFYLKALGKHTWLLTIVVSLATPIGLFFFFEGALIIPLPKGISEPLFEPLYDLIY